MNQRELIAVPITDFIKKKFYLERYCIYKTLRNQSKAFELR